MAVMNEMVAVILHVRCRKCIHIGILASVDLPEPGNPDICRKNKSILSSVYDFPKLYSWWVAEDTFICRGREGNQLYQA